MTVLDACRRCELTSFNSHKDLIGSIVTPSPRRLSPVLGEGMLVGVGQAVAGGGRGLIVSAGGASPPGRDDRTVQICKPAGAGRRVACTSSPSAGGEMLLFYIQGILLPPLH